MGQSNWSGPINSDDGYLIDASGSGYYMQVDSADGYLKIGGGSTVGSNVGLVIQPDGSVNVSADVDLSQVDLGDGSVGAPSLSFQSDDDTGLYRVGADEMAVSTGGTQVMSWDSSQNISIPNGNVTMGSTNSIVLNATAAPNITISNDTTVGGLFVEGDNNGGFSDLYHTWRNGDQTGSSDTQIWIEKLNTGSNDFEALFMGYDFYNFASPVYNIGCDAGNSAAGLDPLVLSYGGVGVGVAAIVTIEDRTSLEVTCGLIRADDQTSGTGPDLTVRAADSSGIGSVGGDLVLSAGSASTDGVVNITSDLDHDGTNLGFYGTAPVAKPTVTGSRGGNAALASLLTALASQGLITDSSSA